MFRFENLEIWNDSRSLSNHIYNITKTWPKSEQFGLSSQVKRSVVSIGANIAEGSAARTKKDFSNFLDHSRKSLYETVSHMYIGLDQGYITTQQMEEIYNLCQKLIKRITAFQNSL